MLDKYYIALIGEASAAGLDKGFSFRYKDFKEAYEDECKHWKFFQSFKRSVLEKPFYYSYLVIGVIISLFGLKAVKYVNKIVEERAIDFYIKNFPDLEWIIKEEKRHYNMSLTP